MKTFKVLEQIPGAQIHLAMKGSEYADEVGQSGDREGALEDLEKDLLRAFKAAQKRKTAAQTPQAANVAGGPGMVKNLAAWHAQQSDAVKAAKQKELNDQVIHLRKWLSRQGAWFGPDGSLL